MILLFILKRFKFHTPPTLIYKTLNRHNIKMNAPNPFAPVTS